MTARLDGGASAHQPVDDSPMTGPDAAQQFGVGDQSQDVPVGVHDHGMVQPGTGDDVQDLRKRGL